MSADAIRFVRLGTGERLRSVKTGSGPDPVLMHTVRTQLDLLQLVIPRFARRFTVSAFDLPGFGWSDIRDGAVPDEPGLCARIKDALTILDITRPILVGESIGATLALVRGRCQWASATGPFGGPTLRISGTRAVARAKQPAMTTKASAYVMVCASR